MIMALAILFYISYHFVIDPALQNGELLNQQISDAEVELARSNDVVANYPALKIEEQNKKQQLIDKYKMFFYDLNQERILYKLDTLIVSTGFTVTNYTPTPVAAVLNTVPVPQYTPVTYPLLDLASKTNPGLIPQKAASSNTEPTLPVETPPAEGEGPASESIPVTDITLGFEQTNYGAAMAFLKSLENMDKSVIIKNVSISKVEAGIDGQIILSVYALPQLDDSQKDLLKFLPVIPVGKANPFN
jgi:hypothetical protein